MPIQKLSQKKTADYIEINAVEELVLSNGYEGIMDSHPDQVSSIVYDRMQKMNDAIEEATNRIQELVV